MPIISAINSKLYKKTCYWLLFINFAKLTVRMSMYELYKIGKFMVYKFTVYCLQQIVDTYKLQVYSILNSLQQITSHWPISELLHMYCWQSVFQRTAWQVDNLFPLDSPSYTVYIMLRCRRKVVVVFISLTFLALLLLLLHSLTSIIERRYVCVTSWPLASASLILRLYERGKHESLGLLWGIFPHLFPCTSLVWLCLI